MSNEIMAGNPAVARNALIAFAVIFIAVLCAYFWLWPLLAERLRDRPAEEQLRYLGWAMLALFLPCFAFAGYFALLALRITRSGQYPPPGMKVIKDTKILRGSDAARIRGLLMALTGLLILLGLIGGIWFPWIFLNQFLPRYAG